MSRAGIIQGGVGAAALHISAQNNRFQPVCYTARNPEFFFLRDFATSRESSSAAFLADVRAAVCPALGQINSMASLIAVASTAFSDFGFLTEAQRHGGFFQRLHWMVRQVPSRIWALPRSSMGIHNHHPDSILFHLRAFVTP